MTRQTPGKLILEKNAKFVKFHLILVYVESFMSNQTKDTLTNFSYGTLVNGFWDLLKLPLWRPMATLPLTLPLSSMKYI